MIAWLLKTDHAVFAAVNGLSGISTRLDALWIFFSSVLIFLMYGGLLVYFFLKWRIRLVPFLSSIISSLAALGVNYFIGSVYYRPRPFLEVPAHLLIHVTDLSKSFPSSHASTVFGLAFGVYFWNRKWGLIMLAAAILTAAGRVLVGVHYPSDVLAGLILGGVCALVIHRGVHLLFKKQIKEVVV